MILKTSQAVSLSQCLTPLMQIYPPVLIWSKALSQLCSVAMCPQHHSLCPSLHSVAKHCHGLSLLSWDLSTSMQPLSLLATLPKTDPCNRSIMHSQTLIYSRITTTHLFAASLRPGHTVMQVHVCSATIMCMQLEDVLQVLPRTCT
jgi:hypothetical protein